MHSILKNKKVIFFDVGYTLDRPASGDWMFTHVFYDYAGDHPAMRRAEDVNAARAAGFDYLKAHHLLHTTEEEYQAMTHYYSIVSDRLGLELTREAIEKIARDRTENMANYIAYPDAHNVLNELKKTHRLGVISDTWPSIVPQLDFLKLSEYFDFTTYSCDLGTFKPDPRMFNDALSKCGYPPEKTVFIDDTPANLTGAAAMGITPILIAANPASDVDTPYPKIRSLTELIMP